MHYGYYWDPTYILVFIGMIFCTIAQISVQSSMKKHSRIRNARGLTGAEVARRILDSEGLYHVQVQCLNSESGDHYDPSADVVRLSLPNYRLNSVTALAVAAHECGHAIQHARKYAPVDIRTALVPVTNIASKASFPLILLGVLLSWNTTLIQIGIWAFAASVLFHVVTLPVEFNASKRALIKIREYNLADEREVRSCRKVLTAAAMTYVAAMAASALQLLRLVLIFNGGGRRRD